MLRQPVSCFHQDSTCKVRASWVGKLSKEVADGLEKGWRPTWPFGHCPNKHVKGCHCWAQSWNLRETVGALPPCKPTHLLGLCVKAFPGELSRIFARSWLKKKMMFPMNSKNRTSHSSITLSIWWTWGKNRISPKKKSIAFNYGFHLGNLSYGVICPLCMVKAHGAMTGGISRGESRYLSTGCKVEMGSDSSGPVCDTGEGKAP